MSALFTLEEATDTAGVVWSIGGTHEANQLLAREHYLGPIEAGGHSLIVIGEREGVTVAAQVWRRPTSRRLPSDGSWLELSRWCLTPGAGENAGSRMHKYAVRTIRRVLPRVTTLVSYSDPSHGHTGALYRACNWQWRPTWLRLRPPPSGQGAWTRDQPQAVKDRWIFAVKRDDAREDVVRVGDAAAVKFWARQAHGAEAKWAKGHPELEAVA